MRQKETERVECPACHLAIALYASGRFYVHVNPLIGKVCWASKLTPLAAAATASTAPAPRLDIFNAVPLVVDNGYLIEAFSPLNHRHRLGFAIENQFGFAVRSSAGWAQVEGPNARRHARSALSRLRATVPV